VTSGEK